ncbi:major facilitator superfamily transporter [Grosmannia clavigera kw1407]|uniref:Major facilitator superfamily transporter n=1 Tax=Grosmannia clavigera (strain kw1407 / UAMH 11150) TaxID=655863 RepID=F0XSP4_GROCL|nr:major facilitator superfamily transporter [Grosmannia clavigera kw1407]EFW99259.1 major facilitator superfamily transporter [Grosmannia clavigera kw1407]
MHAHESSAQKSVNPDVAVANTRPAKLGGEPALDTDSAAANAVQSHEEEREEAAGRFSSSDSDSDDSDDVDGLGVSAHTISASGAAAAAATTATFAAPGETGPPPDNVNDLERLARVNSGPVYSVFTSRQKLFIVSVVTMTSFVSPMTANIYFPALNPIAASLGVSVSLINLTLTTYMIFQGIAPTVFGDFGDMAGRRPAFIIALVIYFFANIGLALQDSYAVLMVLRMIQSGGSSGTLALSYAVVADMAVSSERGKYMAYVGAGVNVGPALSPVLGGLLSEYLGWRSIFWFCCILSACLLLVYVPFVPETSRNVVGNGSVRPRWLNRTLLDIVRQHRHPSDLPPPPRNKLRFPNPLRTLRVVLEKDIFLILIFAAMLYVVFMICVATLSTIFADLYGLDNLQIGLCYLPYGVGCCISAIAQGHVLDWNYRRVARNIGFTIDHKRGDDLSDFPIELARIQPMLPLMVLGIFAVIAYGWVLDFRQPLAAPLVILFLIGLGITGSFGILNTLVVDLYPQAPATAVAGVNLVRCLCGAGVMAFIETMLVRLGRGWTFTLWALLCLAMSPILWLIYRRGPQWRKERRLRLEKKAAEQKDLARRQKDRAPGTVMEVEPQTSVATHISEK